MREGELFVEKIDVNLDGRQIFCLFCGGAVIACLVFVLGVTVGRRVEAREHPDAPAAGAGASDPLAALDQLAAESAAAPTPELTFASTLRGEREGDPLGAVDLSLERPQVAAAPRPEPVAAKPVAKPEPAAAQAAKPEPAAAQAAKPEPAAAQGAKPEPAAQAAKPAPAPAQVSAEAARFTLHLSSFSDRAQADALVARLKKAGYQPYLASSVEEGVTWYRVRVGRYASYEDAVAAKADFEKKQSIIAYVMRNRK